ncbi:MAG: DUF3098 domain-containing protein [Bacteroidales bacterium]|nr:DUF3098 domain-containing protein [Bacteroidales bacterium]
MEEKKFVISKINYILIAVSLVIIVIGFLLMGGKPSGVEFNPDIFSTRRIVVGPMVSFAGFLFMIFAILYKPKSRREE